MTTAPVRLVAGLGAGAVALVSLTWVTTTGSVAATVCTPTVAQPTLDVEPGPVQVGATLRVSGAGWCHPVDGGSRVAIKLDEGAYSHLTADLHPNRTIWALVDADPTDGTFTYDLQLPDGTLAGSEPAFTSGSHSLRALSGSLKPGDTVRSARSTADFVVGEHRPTGVPAPVDGADLTVATGKAVTAKVAEARVTVAVAGGAEGDWVFLSLLAPDGSPRYPWRDAWHRLDADGRVAVGMGEDRVSGAFRLVVQDGNVGRVGELVGWSKVAFPEKKGTTPGTKNPSTRKTDRKTTKKKPAKPVTRKTGTRGTTPGPGTPVAAPPARRAVPLSPVPQVAIPALPDQAPGKGKDPLKAASPQVPGSPIGRWSGFWDADELPSEVDGTELVVAAEASDRVHVHVHDATSSVAAGWVRNDADGRVRLDVGELPTGRYRFALQEGDGDYLGWASVEVPPDGSPVAGSELRGSALAGVFGTKDDPAFSGTDTWLAGMGVVLLAGVGLGTARRKAKA